MNSIIPTFSSRKWSGFFVISEVVLLSFIFKLLLKAHERKKKENVDFSQQFNNPRKSIDKSNNVSYFIK